MCLLGAACMAFSWLEHFRQPEWRAYRAAMFVALGLSGVVPIVQGVGMYSFNHLHKQMGLGWVILQGALYIFGAFLYAVSLWSPPVPIENRKVFPSRGSW